MEKNLKQENALTLYGWKQRFENFLSVVSQLCGKIQTFTQQSRTWDAKKLQKSDLKISSLWFPSSVVKFKHLRNKAVERRLFWMEALVELKLDAQADSLARKIKHYLITTMGVTVEEANPEEFYRAFSLTLREEIMINWTATAHTFKKKQIRSVYYLCMEYMPGRFLGNNIT
ncbi:MAG TPA: hypothetical protein VJ112_02070, partial [Rhabdochlamydiaceae bacterium]|nr:hypothetical protein [Rhabdochlamydiaceae bacterium]